MRRSPCGPGRTLQIVGETAESRLFHHHWQWRREADSEHVDYAGVTPGQRLVQALCEVLATTSTTRVNDRVDHEGHTMGSMTFLVMRVNNFVDHEGHIMGSMTFLTIRVNDRVDHEGHTMGSMGQRLCWPRRSTTGFILVVLVLQVISYQHYTSI